jgi:hypothetical protein
VPNKKEKERKNEIKKKIYTAINFLSLTLPFHTREKNFLATSVE